MNTHILFILPFLLLASCQKKKGSDASSAFEDTAVSAARSDEIELKMEISRGLEDLINTSLIPLGDVEIMGALASGNEADNLMHKRFKAEYLNYLNKLRDKGLVILTNHSQSELDVIGRMGAQTVSVALTDKGKQMTDPKLSSSPDYTGLRIAKCQVLDIVRSAPYQSHKLSSTEEYRLVLGTYQWTPTDIGKVLDPEVKPDKYKFRAVLQLNPFTKRYTYQFADWGKPEEDGWKTHDVE